MHDQAQLKVQREGRVLVLTISNPAQRNAFSPEIYAGGEQAVRDAGTDRETGAIVITGEGDAFSSGGNLSRLRANRGEPPEVQAAAMDSFHGWIRAVRACPKPVIAAVEGFAAGAGCSLALACDLLVAAGGARFMVAHVRVGLTPDGGATGLLAALVPRQVAAEMLLEGRPVAAERLHALGVVSRLVKPGDARQSALAWAAELASGPPAAMARIKGLLNAAAGDDLSAQLDREKAAFLEALYGDEAREGINAFFDKRPPDYKPR